MIHFFNVQRLATNDLDNEHVFVNPTEVVSVEICNRGDFPLKMILRDGREFFINEWVSCIDENGAIIKNFSAFNFSKEH